MILLLLLLLSGICQAGHLFDPDRFVRFKVPTREYRNGSLITVFIKFRNPSGEKNKFSLHFIDNASVKLAENRTAEVTFEVVRRSPDNEIVSAFTNGTLLKESVRPRIKILPNKDEWNRLDIVKFSANELNICYQGYWNGIGTFTRSLDWTRAIYIDSADVILDKSRIMYTRPDMADNPFLKKAKFLDYIIDDPLSWRNPFQASSFRTVPNFKLVGSFLSIKAFMRAGISAPSLAPRNRTPQIYFKSIKEDHKGHFKYFRIVQYLAPSGHSDLYISMEFGDPETRCSFNKTTGDFEHLRIMRHAGNTINLTIYQQNGRENIHCSFNVPYMDFFDDGLTVCGGDGGLPVSVQFNEDTIFPLSRVF